MSPAKRDRRRGLNTECDEQSTRRKVRPGCWRCCLVKKGTVLVGLACLMWYCPETCHGEADQGQAGAVELCNLCRVKTNSHPHGICCIQLILSVVLALLELES
uniref:Uncharacterized protein LOC104215606 isoform X2 n=1 Tax=Nicotiana sylvestris TaxID=4096 RepID=A0A1U7VPD7_NICSY|nr:PREDICTED: uncharacterized protein LOC104215606 isoform X2 [Nicotiana sylvestris]